MKSYFGYLAVSTFAVLMLSEGSAYAELQGDVGDTPAATVSQTPIKTNVEINYDCCGASPGPDEYHLNNDCMYQAWQQIEDIAKDPDVIRASVKAIGPNPEIVYNVATKMQVRGAPASYEYTLHPQICVTTVEYGGPWKCLQVGSSAKYYTWKRYIPDAAFADLVKQGACSISKDQIVKLISGVSNSK